MIFGIDVASILLGGFAAGMVLFIVSVGLSVTMGLMGFVNLAHGGFAMLGGYAIVLAMRHWGVGFLPALALAFAAVAAFSVVTHFDGFQKGVIDSRDLAYFLSVIGFALFATSVILRNR